MILRKRGFFTSLIAICYLLFALGCNNPYMQKDLEALIKARNPEPPIETFTVIFDSVGGSEVEQMNDVEYRSTIEKPPDPTRIGFGFYAWYKVTVKTTTS